MEDRLQGKFCCWDMWKIQIEVAARLKGNGIRWNLIASEKQMIPSENPFDRGKYKLTPVLRYREN